MTLSKSSAKTRQLCLSLLAGLLSACGSETPAFQEKAMNALIDGQSASSIESEYTDPNSADATVYRGEQGESSIEAIPGTQDTASSKTKGADSEQLTIDVKESQLRFGSQTTSVTTLINGDKASDIVYTVSAPNGKDAGKIINGDTYVSPAAGTQPYDVTIVAKSKSDPTLKTSTILKLVPKEQVFAGCTNDEKGFPIKADIFTIPSTSTALPDFLFIQEKTTTVCMDSFQVPNRSWSDGFPGHPQLIEWFALRATSRLSVTVPGKYFFKLNADDGAKLYIDGELVVDNDGLHAEKAVVGSINLVAGEHDLVMEYFQGPRYHIALQLYWKAPGTSSYTYVPSNAFKP